jgi:hypothetical protein
LTLRREGETGFFNPPGEPVSVLAEASRMPEASNGPLDARPQVRVLLRMTGPFDACGIQDGIQDCQAEAGVVAELTSSTE